MAETANPAELKENIAKVFKSFDTDNSGFLDKPEIKKASKELGQELTDEEIDQIFKDVAKSKPGLISLTEFTEWFINGKVNKLVNLVKLRLAAMNLVEKTDKFNKAFGKAIKNKSKDQKPEVFEGKVKFGHDKTESKVELKMYFGKEAEEVFGTKKVSMDLSSTLAFMIRFEVDSNVDDALKALQETVEHTITFLKIVAEEEAGQALGMLKIQYAKDDKNIYLGISSDHEFFTQPIEGFANESLEQLPPDFEAKAKFELGIKNTLKSLKNDVSKEKFVLTVLQGLELEGEVKIDPDFFKKLREAFFEDIYPESLSWNSGLNRQVLWSLINGGKAKLQFKDMGTQQATDFLKRIGSGESLDATPTTEELLNLARASQFQEFLTMAPGFVTEWIDFLRHHVEADVSFMIKIPKFFGELKLKTKGVREVFDFIFDKTD